jgi:predicted RecA/RadA family phage recombinase
VATATWKKGYGRTVAYTPVSAVTAGDVVVQSNLVGVAPNDIAANALGTLVIEGIYTFPKTAGTGEAIAAGDLVYWDAGGEVMTETVSGNTRAGVAELAAGDSATTVDVVLVPGTTT